MKEETQRTGKVNKDKNGLFEKLIHIRSVASLIKIEKSKF